MYAKLWLFFGEQLYSAPLAKRREGKRGEGRGKRRREESTGKKTAEKKKKRRRKKKPCID
jgi:hypothetical protein